MRKETNIGKDDRGEKEAIRQQGNPNKEPVAEAMTRKNFYTVIAVINDKITKEEVLRVYIFDTCVYEVYVYIHFYTYRYIFTFIYLSLGG